MSSRTPNQEKALAWYCTEKQLNPQLSAHPVYSFTKKSNGKPVEANIFTIVREWERSREDERQSRKRSRR